MAYIEKAVSNSSTLISFYRTKKFYPYLKILFKEILIPSECWEEMVTGEKGVDEKFADRKRILKDKNIFLNIIQLNAVERNTVAKLMEISRKREVNLHKAEALAISLALNRNIKHVLTEDKIALEILKDSEGLIGFGITNIFQELIKNLELFFVSPLELYKTLNDFEEESKVKLSKRSREAVVITWENCQKGLKLD